MVPLLEVISAIGVGRGFLKAHIIFVIAKSLLCRIIHGNIAQLVAGN